MSVDDLAPKAPRILPLRSGVDYSLEDDADRWLADGRRADGGGGAGDNYLSRDQMNLRRAREVYNHHGLSDEALIAGLFRRCFNPTFGQRPNRGRMRSDEG